MHVWVRPSPHTHTERGLRFPLQYHTSYKWGCFSAPYCLMLVIQNLNSLHVCMALIWLSEVISEVYYGINFLVIFFKLETSNTNDFMKIRFQTHCCQKLSYFNVYVTNTWLADGNCETSLYSPLTFKRLSHSGTKACISTWKKSMLNVCSQKETACFTVASVVNCLPGRYFVRSPKGWNSMGKRWDYKHGGQ